MSTPFSAGSARADITPSPSMINWVTGLPYSGVLSPLYVRVLAVREGKKSVLIFAFDLLSIRIGFASALRRSVQEQLGIAPENVLLHASHSHSAPRSPWLENEPAPHEKEKFRAVLSDPQFQCWGDSLVARSLECAGEALGRLTPATPAIRRIYAGDWVYNRRVRQPDGTVQTRFSSGNPYSLPAGGRFGDTDPVMTCIDLLDPAQRPVAKLVHFACHPVAVYPTDKAISADWPGMLCAKQEEAEGAETFFLLGCAGDQVPAFRGAAAAEKMAATLSERIDAAIDDRTLLPGRGMDAFSEMLELPLLAEAVPLWGSSSLPAEVQVIRLGEVVLVTLPGEPLLALSREIVRRSPFAHTLVLGYSNGRGTVYTGFADDKARGGYESGLLASPGQPECGERLVEAACRLLQKLADR